MERRVFRNEDFSLSEEQEALRSTLAAFFAKECPTTVVRKAEPLGFDADLWGRLVELGVVTMGVPEPLGGDGAGLVELALAPGADPFRLLEECRRLEAAAGRVRTAHWGPRTLDADVLWIDGVALDEPELTVPHPLWRERKFVMAPLSELAPDLADAVAVADAGGEVVVVGTL